MAATRLGLFRDTSSVFRGPRPGLAIKRAADLTFGVALALLALPLMASIALAIRMDSPGPALYRPRRIGRGGGHFSMFKFRTMIVDAESRLEEFAHLNMANGMVKIPDDPRVTRVGKWLRRFSLDELPQLFNVIAGHMSLVGPRPHDVKELEGADLKSDLRLAMRPGLTGLWQVSARSDPDLNRRLHFDHTYVRDWSLILDMKILAKTVPTVVRGEGGRVTAPATSDLGQRRRWR